jgi:5-enolpyruvylshikimate-3-phosphate synthase
MIFIPDVFLPGTLWERNCFVKSKGKMAVVREEAIIKRESAGTQSRFMVGLGMIIEAGK